jgi:flagellar biogenesis protein FliO
MRLGWRTGIWLVWPAAILIVGERCGAEASVAAQPVSIVAAPEKEPAPRMTAANDPIALNSRGDRAATRHENLEIAPAVAETLNPPMSANPGPAGAASGPHSNERKGLGQPNGLFSAKPQVNQPMGEEQPSGGSSVVNLRSEGIVRVIGATTLVVFAAWIVARVARRIGGPLARARRPSGVVEILARFPVGRGQQLVLVKLGRRILLVHQGGAAMTTLTELVDENEVASMLARIEAGARDGLAPRFQSMLERFNAEHANAGGRSKTERGDDVRAALLDSDGAEIVDLTRSDRRGLLSWLLRPGVTP